MNPLPRLFVAGCFAISVSVSASGQSVSIIGSYLEIPGPHGYPEPEACAMTPDGKTIAFVETDGVGCDATTYQKISLIRPDGTGYRVVVEADVLKALAPTPAETQIFQLLVSGDAKWISFWWPHEFVFGCTYDAPMHSYVVNVETGAIHELMFNGQQVYGVSFTDDGQTMCFQALDPAVGRYVYFLANPDGTGAVPFFDPVEWTGSFGVLSGDGSRLVFVGFHAPNPLTEDVYVYDLASATVTKLSPDPLIHIGAVSSSYDGSRIVYGGAANPLYGVNGDGSGFHLISTYKSGGSATISRDGNYAFLLGYNGGIRCFRVNWDGTGLIEIDGQANVPFEGQAPLAIDATGSRLAHFVFNTSPPAPLAVWSADERVLTTYGYGTPGSLLSWDIGGQPGDAALLAYSLDAASIPFKNYGTLELGLSSLHCFWAGTVAPPWNTASLQLALPADLVIPTPLPIHFQALVMGPSGTTLTNSTVFTLQPAASSAAATLVAPSRGVRTAGAPAREPDPEARRRCMEYLIAQMGQR